MRCVSFVIPLVHHLQQEVLHDDDSFVMHSSGDKVFVTTTAHTTMTRSICFSFNIDTFTIVTASSKTGAKKVEAWNTLQNYITDYFVTLLEVQWSCTCPFPPCCIPNQLKFKAYSCGGRFQV
jgi:hypothetical protein